MGSRFDRTKWDSRNSGGILCSLAARVLAAPSFVRRFKLVDDLVDLLLKLRGLFLRWEFDRISKDLIPFVRFGFGKLAGPLGDCLGRRSWLPFRALGLPLHARRRFAPLCNR